MFEWWRQWRYARLEANKASADWFSEYEEFLSGPWTSSTVARLPLDVLIKGPQLGGIDGKTRQLIDIELERRRQTLPNAIATVALLVSLASLAVSVLAMVKS